MANPLFAQTVRYAYDKDGRITQVTHGDGVVDTYQYDFANNLIKNTGVPDNASTTFSLTDYTPKSGIVGAAITITGTAFSHPTVSFNGIPATVTTSTDTSLTVAVPTGATSGPLTVTVGGQTLTAGAFNVLADPNAFSVADFTPKTAAVGNSLTITGTGFTNPTVTINGVSAPVTASTSTSLTVTVPTGVTSGPVVVAVNGQTQSVGTFTVANPVPTFAITDFTPKAALVGSSVTITGTGFSNPSVAFNGIPATVTNSTATSITATVPAGAVTGPLTVTVGGQSQTAGTFTAVTVTVAPTLTTYSLPTAQPGDTITLTGSNFDTSSPASNTVTVGGIEAQVTAVTANQITFVVPLMPVDINPIGPILNGGVVGNTPGTPKTVTVQTAGGITSAPKPLYLVPRIVFKQPANQSLTGTFSSYGDNGLILLPQGGAYNFLVDGSNVNGTGTMDVFIFGPDNTLVQTFVVPYSPFALQVGGSFQGSTQISLPPGGPYVIQTVFGYDLSRGFQATGTVNFGIADPLSIASFAPQAGLEGDSVTITGKGFVNPTVRFGNTPATVTASTSSSITATVPAQAVSGQLVVQVGNDAQVAGNFTVIPWTVTSFAPQTGTQGNSITISGTNFSNPVVTFDGVQAQVLTSSPTSITVTVPYGLTVGTHALKVTNRGNTKTAGSFAFIAPYTITGFTPLFGSPGESTTITGNGFDNPTVAFNGIQAVVTAKTATSLTVTVPNGLSDGAQNITVTDGGVTQSLGYYFVSNPTNIASISPVAGRPGDSITITGTGFRGQGHPFDPPRVAFNGVYAQVTSFTSTSITAVVPNRLNAGIQTVTVQNPGEPILNAGFYTVTANPIDPTPVNQITIDTLHSFNGLDGANPFARLLPVSDGSFYGSSYTGGANGQGTIFRVTQNGTVTVIHSFNGVDGLKPNELIQASDGNFYGTTKEGGANGKGTIFRLATDGTFNTLYSFNGTDGDSPRAGLLQANDGNLYGTTFSGGSNGQGVLFRLGLDGTLATVYDFGSPDGFDLLDPLFTDAENPSGQLIQGNDGALYGTTEGGGDLSSPGTIYSMTLTGTETVLDFNFLGDIPVGGFIQTRDGNFYFTVSSTNGGTIYRITPGGSVGYSFSYGQGGSPTGGLFEGSDGNIYGTTSTGGSQDLGTIFRYQPDTSFGSFDSLYSFNGQNGSHPFGGLTQGSDGSLYGSTFDGGTNNQGTLFKLTLAVPPSITSFSPASAPVGSAVLIKGINFTGTTGVSFNGIPATFTVNSPTQITAIVPPDGVVGALSPKIFDTNFALLRNKNIAVNGFFSLGTLNATSGKFISLVGPRLTLSKNSLRLAAVVIGPPPVPATGFITVTTPNGSTTSLTPFTVTP
jgi:uncharacterized repeat protein (TIGR03803 family)/YD repeat-containing protein